MGLAAKLVDVPEVTWRFPIFDNIGGRFGIWIFAAALLAVRSKTPLHSAIRVFGFFAAMLLTYYLYTILFLGFFPKSQMILWGSISLISPFCAIIMWYANENKRSGEILAALPIALLLSEWFVTGDGNLILLLAYLVMIVLILIVVSQNIKRCMAIIIFAMIITFILINTGFMDFICRELLNI